MEKHIFVIGLGSMGKRRIRNLQSLGYKNLIGFDLREDRKIEVRNKYFIKTVDTFEQAIELFQFEAFVISVPPDLHYYYLNKAIDLKIPAFVEASVVDTQMDEIIKKSKEKNIFIAPSCTLHFHPAIKKITEIIKTNELGHITNIIYHSGQYLPDWHTYENVKDFYVSKKETGGGREIVPFELTWITLLFGFPDRITGFFKKTIKIDGAEEIDDTYNILLDFGTMIFNLNVDVVSRFASRRLMINGDEKQLIWNWEDNLIKIFDPNEDKWNSIYYDTLSAEFGYNKNITEQMYIDEMNSFIKAIDNIGTYPNTLLHDHKVLKILYNVEKSCTSNKIINN
jgi:predicted dehydrogenase